jgi:hypothetical protein
MSIYELPRRPISSTLEVYMNGQWCHEARKTGTPIRPAPTTLVFHGSYKPAQNIADSGPPRLIAVYYDTYIAGCKATGSVYTRARRS